MNKRQESLRTSKSCSRGDTPGMIIVICILLFLHTILLDFWVGFHMLVSSVLLLSCLV